MVLPNKFCVKLSEEVDTVELKTPEPQVSFKNLLESKAVADLLGISYMDYPHVWSYFIFVSSDKLQENVKFTLVLAENKIRY